MNHADAFRYGPSATAIVGLDGRFLDVSDRFCEVMGRSREALLNSSFRELSSPGDRAEDERVLKALLEGRASITREKRYLLPNGDEFCASLSVASVRDGEGKPCYFVSTVDNLAPRQSRRLEQYNLAIYGLTRHPALHRGNVNEFLQHLTTTIADVLQVARVSVWYFSEVPEEHIRLTSGCFDGKPAEQGTKLAARDYPSYFEAMRTQRLIVADQASVHPATREFAETYLAPLGITSMLDAPIVIGDRLVGVVCHEHTGSLREWTADEQTFAGAAAYLVSLAEQVSRTLKAESDLRRLNQELERRVAARTSDLEAFSYSVSHDLRAPLRAMGGFARVLTTDYRDQLDEAGRDYLQRISGAAVRMGRLIDALLALSRYSHQHIQLTAVDLSAIANSIVDDLRERDPERKVEFVNEPLVRCRGDKELIEDMLRNLLENAWKFTSDVVPARIEFGQVTQEDGGPSDTYFVRDNGIGFQQHQAGDLFKPFRKLHSSKGSTGSGIGLATVQRIVARHGGQTWAESQPGQGATFFFTLQGCSDREG